jgi:hypothetical protein
LVEAFKGQDVVVSVLGAGGLGDESKIIDAAVTAGVKRFIPSQFGSNTQNKKACGLLPILSGKAAVIEHLKKQEVHGLSWTGITTGLAFDWVGYFFVTVFVTVLITFGSPYRYLGDVLIILLGSARWLAGLRHQQTHGTDHGRW